MRDICIPEEEFLDELEEEYNLVENTKGIRSKVELEALLNKALQDENYEEAAKLRDEIDNLHI